MGLLTPIDRLSRYCQRGILGEIQPSGDFAGECP